MIYYSNSDATLFSNIPVLQQRLILQGQVAFVAEIQFEHPMSFWAELVQWL